MMTKYLLFFLLLALYTTNASSQKAWHHNPNSSAYIHNYFDAADGFERHLPIHLQQKLPDYKAYESLKQRLDSVIHYTTETDMKETFIYDAHGRVLEQIQERKYDSLTWTNSWKFEYEYDSAGYLIEYVRLRWIFSNQSWTEYRKELYFYDKNNLLTSLEVQDWDWSTEAWDPFRKNIFHYDSNNCLSKQEKHSWDPNIQTFIIYGKNEYLQHINQQDSIISYFRLNSSNQWAVQSEIRNNYNSNARKIKSTTYLVSEDTLDYELLNKYEYGFDDSGNLTHETFFEWSSTNSTWENKTRKEYDYNFNYHSSDLIVPNQYIQPNQTIEVKEFEWAENGWISSADLILYYSEQEVYGIDEASDFLSKVYPNPASDHLIILLDKSIHYSVYNLYDIQGRLVFSKELNQINKLDITNVNPGVYIYNILNKDKIQTGKLVIK